MIRNILMIKLAGGEELCGSGGADGKKASKRLKYCQRVVNKLQEGAEVCERPNSSACVCVNSCVCGVCTCVEGVMSGYITAYCEDE